MAGETVRCLRCDQQVAVELGVVEKHETGLSIDSGHCLASGLSVPEMRREAGARQIITGVMRARNELWQASPTAVPACVWLHGLARATLLASRTWTDGGVVFDTYRGGVGKRLRRGTV